MLALQFDADPVDDDGLPVSSFGAGDLLPGGGRAIERLGVGYRCETWLAWTPQMWCPAVVKFPRPHQLDHPRARVSLRREVAALGGNLHPGLPRVYSDGTGDPVPNVVFEYVDGLALDDEIDENDAMSAAEVAVLGAQLLAAVRTVHARGLAHVDIKPENVVLRDARPVLVDFGSARPLGHPQPAGCLIGSPGYAAPELEAGEPISTAMDVYGIGVTLYEARCGATAFDAAVPAGDRPHPTPLPDCDLAELVHRMLAADPAKRPTAAEALAALGAVTEIWPAWLRRYL